MSNKENILITIAPSHYCEKARWALEYLGVNYTEDAYLPVFHMKATKKHSGRSVPLLITKDGIYKDSTAILKYLDKVSDTKIYPESENDLNEADELEALFDKNLGPHTRRWAYFYLLDNTTLLHKEFLDGKKPMDEMLFKLGYPVIKAMMKKSMNVNFNSKERSLKKVREVFDIIDQKLLDGRKYIMGDKFSAVDISFASLADPVLLHKYSENDLKELPEKMLIELNEFRDRKAGQFALDLFENERKVKI